MCLLCRAGAWCTCIATFCLTNKQHCDKVPDASCAIADAGMREQLDADQDDVDGDGQPATRVVSVLDPSERDENDQPMFVDIEVNAEG